MVEHQDLCILPSKSSLHVYGRLTRADGTTATTTTNLVSNAICYLFDKVRYELNGIEINRCKNVGLTSTINVYVKVILCRMQDGLTWKKQEGLLMTGDTLM